MATGPVINAAPAADEFGQVVRVAGTVTTTGGGGGAVTKMSLLLALQGEGPPPPSFFGWRMMVGVGLSVVFALLLG